MDGERLQTIDINSKMSYPLYPWHPSPFLIPPLLIHSRLTPKLKLCELARGSLPLSINGLSNQPESLYVSVPDQSKSLFAYKRPINVANHCIIKVKGQFPCRSLVRR